LDQFRSIGVDIIPVTIDKYKERKDNIRKKLFI